MTNLKQKTLGEKVAEEISEMKERIAINKQAFNDNLSPIEKKAALERYLVGDVKPELPRSSFGIESDNMTLLTD